MFDIGKFDTNGSIGSNWLWGFNPTSNQLKLILLEDFWAWFISMLTHE